MDRLAELDFVRGTVLYYDGVLDADVENRDADRRNIEEHMGIFDESEQNNVESEIPGGWDSPVNVLTVGERKLYFKKSTSLFHMTWFLFFKTPPS